MSRYFRPSVAMPKIYLYRDPVDFRKSYRGLAALVEQEIGHNPFDGGLYAFTNRQRDQTTFSIPIVSRRRGISMASVVWQEGSAVSAHRAAWRAGRAHRC